MFPKNRSRVDFNSTPPKFSPKSSRVWQKLCVTPQNHTKSHILERKITQSHQTQTSTCVWQFSGRCDEKVALTQVRALPQTFSHQLCVWQFSAMCDDQNHTITPNSKSHMARSVKPVLMSDFNYHHALHREANPSQFNGTTLCHW